ncbi:MAG: 2-oxoacid:acceptor oxidoreductase family protein [Candidatus Bipolaricaulota bacterium]|nr:2-oxoacid:acceptor oxidoreductase family protein [Candidatus Bipolaricaulota bacterium]
MRGETAFVLSGIGGQGVLFAGRLLARALVSMGRHVALRYAYGAEVMGTAVHAEVVAAAVPILCPFPEAFDAALVLHRAALPEVLLRLSPGGLLLADAAVTVPNGLPGIRVEKRPFVLLAGGGPGDPGRASPLVALGFLARLGYVPLEALLEAAAREPAAEENRAFLLQGHALA